MRILLASVLAGWMALASAQPASDAALQMVRSLQLGANLTAMTVRLAPRTQTWQAAVANVGAKKADELLRAEIAVVVPKYQQQWDMNLAAAWAPLMTSDELRSMAQLKQSSPYAQKFGRLQNEAGASMRLASEPLLAKVLGEIMNGVFAKSQPER